MKRAHILAWCALTLGVGACSDGTRPIDGSPGAIGAIGDLGNGAFFYQCTDAADSVCDERQSDFPSGQSFAVGARFGMFYRNASGVRGVVESASPKRLSDAGSVFLAEKSGVVSVISSNGRHATDMIHLRLEVMRELRLEVDKAAQGGGLQDDALAMTAGDRLVLRATPHSEDGGLLAGAVPTVWESGDLSVVSFAGSDRDNQVELVAARYGVAQIYLTMGEMMRTITINVARGEGPNRDIVFVPYVPGELTQVPGLGGVGGAGGAGGGGSAGGQGGQ